MASTNDVEKLTKEQAWRYTQLMNESFGRESSEERFNADFAKLDFDGSGTVTFDEIKTYGLDKRDRPKDLAIGIIWIGHTLKPDDV